MKQIPYCEVYKIGQTEFDNDKVQDSQAHCFEKADLFPFWMKWLSVIVVLYALVPCPFLDTGVKPLRVPD